MRSVAPHIYHIHCIIHRQHLVARNIGGDMEQVLSAAIHVFNIVISNSVNDTYLSNSGKTKVLMP